MSIAIKIRQERLKLGISQADFAQMIGVSVATVNRWENGAYKPSKIMRKIMTEKLMVK